MVGPLGTHINDRSFGLLQMESTEQTVIDRYLDTLPALDGISTHIVTRKAFDLTMGVADYNGSQGNWDLVRSHPNLDCITNCEYQQTMAKFASSAVATIFGINIIQFMNEIDIGTAQWMLDFAENVSSQKQKK